MRQPSTSAAVEARPHSERREPRYMLGMHTLREVSAASISDRAHGQDPDEVRIRSGREGDPGFPWSGGALAPRHYTGALSRPEAGATPAATAGGSISESGPRCRTSGS